MPSPIAALELAGYPPPGCGSMIVLCCVSSAPRSYSILLTDVYREVDSIDTRNSQDNSPRLSLRRSQLLHSSPQHSRVSLTASSSATNFSTISFVQPRQSRHAITRKEPPIMNGLRRPHLLFESSEMTPTSGCMIKPDNGPAIHTAEVCDLVRPSCRR